MSKSIIWNQLKALGYEAKQLKADYDVSYQQASLSLLEGILGGLEFIKEILENEVQGVNENLGSQCGGVTDNDLNQSEVVINSSTTLSDNNDTGNDLNLTNSTSVATETSDNVTEFRGIPVEHYNFKHEVYIDSVLKDTSGVLISKYLGTHAVSFNDGEQRKSDITLLEAVKLAKQWLGVKTAISLVVNP